MIILLVILVGALALYGIVASSGQHKPAKKRKRSSNRVGSADTELVAQRWATVQAMAASGGNGLRTAVSDADKLLDYVMKGKGYRGETMAERLKSAQSQLSNRNATWEAHKLRNALAHEMDFDLVPSQAKQALASFERAIRDLGGLK